MERAVQSAGRIAPLLGSCLLGACFWGLERPRGDDAGVSADAGSQPEENPPHASIEEGPMAPLYVPRGTFTLACDDEPCSLECRVDEQAFAPCEGIHVTSPLRPGTHRFEARARRGEQTGPASAHVFENRLPYELIQRAKPLVLKDGWVELDLRCRRADLAWDGEDMFGRPVLPFQCSIAYDLVRADARDQVEFRDGRWTVAMEVTDDAEHVVLVRVAKPADDPTPWPDGSFAEHMIPVVRTLPVPPYVAKTPASPQPGAFRLGTPSYDAACAGISSWHRADRGDTIELNSPLAGFYPPQGDQLAHCLVRIPVTVASGWNAAKAELRLRGYSENAGKVDVDIQLDGSPLVAARVGVDASSAQLSLPITYTNWSPCPRTVDLVIDVDLSHQDPTDATLVFLDSMELDFDTQGGFGWQTCAP